MFSWKGCFGSSAVREPPLPARPVPVVLPSISSRPISDWRIDRHRRDALATTIIPYMAPPLEDKHNLHSITKKYPWIKEFIQSETANTPNNDNNEFRDTKAAFWDKPSGVSADLLRVARILFYILVRYTYLTHFQNGREASQAILDLDDLVTDRHDACYFSGLDPNDADRLIHLRRYGTGFYRASYRDTTRRIAWRNFCTNVLKFCQSLELHPSTDDPEVNIKDIQQNLISVLHRKIQSDISSNAKRMRTMSRELKKLNEQLSSGTIRDEQSLAELKNNIGEMNRQLEETQTRLDTDLSRKETDMALGFEEWRTTFESRLESIASDVTRNEGDSKLLAHKMQNELAEVRNTLGDMGTMQVQHAKAHIVGLCRWLMETIPFKMPNGPKTANERWRIFWAVNWNACKKKQRKTHPLWPLIHDQKYDKVGKELFTTMNGKIHGYGADIGKPLPVDVQKVIDAIMPARYMSNKPDINLERKRWKI